MKASQLPLFHEMVKAYGGEALFRPSSISRVLHCPGSVYLSTKVPRERKSSRYALEGTAAHVVFNHALSGERQPDEWTDRMVKLDDKGMEGWFVDSEMTENIQFSVSVVADYLDDNTEMFLEHFLTLQPLDPSDIILSENRGTTDVSIVNKRRRKLTIIDLKYGKRILVPSDAPQLLDYALMGLVKFGIDEGWDEVETVIIQPRAFNENERVKSSVFSPNALLMDFAGSLVGSMEAAIATDAPLAAGDWCRWCPAAPICPALAAAGMSVSESSDMVAATLKATSPMPPIPREMPKLPSVADMEGEALSILLSRRPMYDAWIAAAEQRAIQLVEAGVEVPGWEVKRGLGNRRWADPQTAANILRTELGVSLLDMYTERKLLSPAQMEKLITKDRRDSMNDLTERPEGELQLKKKVSLKKSLSLN